ncbi:hypothetical protein, partial [Paraburkholderia caledonica]|uniref:hypothetical protein n=1 Tax=Paraburkholderia caledonica TaxID=134536 RepID=UPI003C891C9C
HCIGNPQQDPNSAPSGRAIDSNILAMENRQVAYQHRFRFFSHCRYLVQESVLAYKALVRSLLSFNVIYSALYKSDVRIRTT